MTLPKFTDPAVQNRTQDAATDHVDDIQHKIDNPGKGKNSNSEDKKKDIEKAITIILLLNGTIVIKQTKMPIAAHLAKGFS
jgi:hypothetical protein